MSRFDPFAGYTSAEPNPYPNSQQQQQPHQQHQSLSHNFGHSLLGHAPSTSHHYTPNLSSHSGYQGLMSTSYGLNINNTNSNSFLDSQHQHQQQQQQQHPSSLHQNLINPAFGKITNPLDSAPNPQSAQSQSLPNTAIYTNSPGSSTGNASPLSASAEQLSPLSYNTNGSTSLTSLQSAPSALESGTVTPTTPDEDDATVRRSRRGRRPGSASSASSASTATTKSGSGRPRARYISVRDPECVHALRCLVEAVKIYPRRNSNQFSKECLEMAAKGWRDWQAENHRPEDASVAQIRAHYHNKMNEWAAWNKRASNPENRVVDDRVYFKDCHGKTRSARRLPIELENLILELHKSLPRPGYTKRKSEDNTPAKTNVVPSNTNPPSSSSSIAIPSAVSAVASVSPSDHPIKHEEAKDVFIENVLSSSYGNNNAYYQPNQAQSQDRDFQQRMLPPVNSVPLNMSVNQLNSLSSNPLNTIPSMQSVNHMDHYYQQQQQQQQQQQHHHQHQSQQQHRNSLEWNSSINSYNHYNQYANQHNSQYMQQNDSKHSYSLQSLLHPSQGEKNEH